MTGMRVGYMLAPTDVIEKAAKVHDALTICAPTLSQKIALLMLKYKNEWSKNYLDQFKKKRQIMLKKLNKDIFSYSSPEGAYYIFVKYNADVPSKEMALELLRGAKVITIPGEGFGGKWNRHLRLSFAGEEVEIAEGIDKVNKWMLKY
jgi:aminotransferase